MWSVNVAAVILPAAWHRRQRGSRVRRRRLYCFHASDLYRLSVVVLRPPGLSWSSHGGVMFFNVILFLIKPF
jgi:hypothetical protein